VEHFIKKLFLKVQSHKIISHLL